MTVANMAYQWAVKRQGLSFDAAKRFGDWCMKQNGDDKTFAELFDLYKEEAWKL